MKISIPIKITNNLYLKDTNTKKNNKKQIEADNSFNFSSFSSNAIKNQFLKISFKGEKSENLSSKKLDKNEFDEIFVCEKQREIGLDVEERFSKEQLEQLAQLANKANKFLLDRVVNEYNFDALKNPHFLFSSDEIVRIMQIWNVENDFVLDKALFQKEDDKSDEAKPRFSVDEAILIAKMYPDNKNVIDEMLFTKDFDGQKYFYDSSELIELLKMFNKSEEKRDKYTQVFNLLTGYSLPVEDINDFLPLSYSEINEIIDRIRRFKQEMGLKDDIKIKFLQNDSGVEVSLRSDSVSCVDENASVDKEAILFRDGSKAKSTLEVYDDNSFVTWYFGKDRVIYTKYLDEVQEDIDYQIELKNNSNGEVQFVEYTKQSDKLIGAYDTTTYDLKNYPEDLDVLGLLKKGELDKTIEELGLEKGKKISSVESSDNVTTLTENFVRNGKTTSRRYVEKLDSEGQKVSIEYSYHIQDEDGKELLSLDRSWEKDSDYSYRTKVNGQEYRTEFYENGLNFDVYRGDVLIDRYDVDSLLINQEEQDSYRFLNFIKQLPSDLVLKMFSELDGIILSQDAKDYYSLSFNRINLSIPTVDVLAHEMGHALDIKYNDLYSGIIDAYQCHSFPYFEKYPTLLTEISSDEEVLEIYNEEFDKFKKDYPEHIQYFVEYFSPYPDCNAIGIEEFVAETYMLLFTYGNAYKNIHTRAEYIVKYFPMTVAKIAEIFKSIDGI